MELDRSMLRGFTRNLICKLLVLGPDEEAELLAKSGHTSKVDQLCSSVSLKEFLKMVEERAVKHGKELEYVKSVHDRLNKLLNEGFEAEQEALIKSISQ